MTVVDGAAREKAVKAMKPAAVVYCIAKVANGWLGALLFEIAIEENSIPV